MGKSYMESVILEEVRKLSKILGFTSNGLHDNEDVNEGKSRPEIRNSKPFNTSDNLRHDNQKSIECYDIKGRLFSVNKLPKERKTVVVGKLR